MCILIDLTKQVQGLSVIKAFQQQKRFAKDFQDANDAHAVCLLAVRERCH